MAANWIQKVEITDIRNDKEYFLGKKVGHEDTEFLFLSENMKGKKMWSQKPGIAMRIIGNEKLTDFLKTNTNCVAIAIPSDADRRWRRRKAV